MPSEPCQPALLRSTGDLVLVLETPGGLLHVSDCPFPNAGLAQKPAGLPPDFRREPRRGDLRRPALVDYDPASANDLRSSRDPQGYGDGLGRRRSFSVRDLSTLARDVHLARRPGTLVPVTSSAVEPRLLPDECPCPLSG